MPKPKNLSVDELLRRACNYAEQDRVGFLAAMEPCRGGGDDELIAETEQFIKQLRAYRRKRWGKSTSDTLDEKLASMEAKPIQEVLRDTRFKMTRPWPKK